MVATFLFWINNFERYVVIKTKESKDKNNSLPDYRETN